MIRYDKPEDKASVQDLVMRCMDGVGDYHPVIGNPVLWRTQGVCDIDKVIEVPVAILTPWSDIPYGPVWDATKGDGFDVIGQAPNRVNANGSRNKNARDFVRFHASGYVNEVDRTASKKGKIKDPFKPNICGIGYFGGSDLDTHDPVIQPIYKAWNNMIQRCYAIDHNSYQAYGALGVRVCRRWHSFEAFYQDAIKLPGYAYKQTNESQVALDKDHFGHKTYGPDTCIWLPKDVNAGYISNSAFEAISPEGEVFYHFSATEFADAHGLTQSKVSDVIAERAYDHKGWRFYKAAGNYRYQVYESPLRDAVQALLREQTHEFYIGPNPKEEYTVDDIIVRVQKSSKGMVLYVKHNEPVDVELSHKVYWIIGTLIARTVKMPFAKLVHETEESTDEITSMNWIVDESVSHLNEVKAKHIRLYGESETIVERQFAVLQRVQHGDRRTPEYTTWCGINQRCNNPTNPDYKNYGGRGITVADEWCTGYGYVQFLKDMGRKPSMAHSIDRIDYNGPYSKENCRWATRTEQNRNKRSNVLVTIDGETQPLSYWTEKSGIAYNTARQRIDAGWDKVRAVQEPVKFMPRWHEKDLT